MCLNRFISKRPMSRVLWELLDSARTYLAATAGTNSGGGVRALESEARPRYFLPVFLTMPRDTRF